MTACHAVHPGNEIHNGSCVALVGNPNVGKSVLFHRLTGQYVMVSNYPGTTVEVSQGKLRNLQGVTLIDTPGVIGFPSRSEDEQVTEKVLFHSDLRTVIQWEMQKIYGEHCISPFNWQKWDYPSFWR